jgi:aspartate/methionine/tyrosine aminotransferase
MEGLLESSRARETIPSPIASVIHLLAHAQYNMGQGMVWWGPSENTVSSVLAEVVGSGGGTLQPQRKVDRYGPIEGDPALKEALKRKLIEFNGIELDNKEIMVTAGSNQAFVNIILSICSPGDEVIMFMPYYFNHVMAVQLASAQPVFAPCRDDDMQPDIDALLPLITSKTKAIVLISPNNPTGAVATLDTVEALQKICNEKKLWFISDEAYEYFLFEEGINGGRHITPKGPNVINTYTFSKAYGMAGWRVGYAVYPRSLKPAMDKCQDTIPINACQFSQQLALAALRDTDKNWLIEKMETLKRNRETVWQALEPLHRFGGVKSPGSIYFFCKLPPGVDDMKAVEFLATKHKVWVLAGSGFGYRGWLRVSFGNMAPEQCERAAVFLNQGLQEIVEGKMEAGGCGHDTTNTSK